MKIARSDRVDTDEMLTFVRMRRHAVLTTYRQDGTLQSSPVSMSVDADGRILVATYPQRAKTHNLRRDPRVSLCVLSDEWNGPWIQVDGRAEVLDMPDQAAEEGLVDYFRAAKGEHPDWEEYRQAMRRQNKSLLRIRIDRWGPVATGGFPPELAED